MAEQLSETATHDPVDQEPLQSYEAPDNARIATSELRGECQAFSSLSLKRGISPNTARLKWLSVSKNLRLRHDVTRVAETDLGQQSYQADVEIVTVVGMNCIVGHARQNNSSGLRGISILP